MNKEMNWADFGGAKYLKQEDIQQLAGDIDGDGSKGVVVVLKRFLREKVGSEEEIKGVVYTETEDGEDLRPWIAAKVCIDTIAKLTGAKTPRDAAGRKVELYVDPTVSFGNKLVGGIRVRRASDE